ncbi:hypothetical protein GCM10011369_34770 [Neiella marina]|uniref:Uncharacterized protein n=1 Tax=Neiella marina TaxID=508461 RepID=A0A8J2UA31_9GAMM|nr:hypothetical protein [Neiella marina]GGA89623.1 hypothetical protein GCM10011369_34770 [Neiella marina]
MANTTTWPDLAIALYEKLNERNAELTYEFEQMQIGVPSSAGAGSETAHWTINGVLKIRARDISE